MKIDLHYNTKEVKFDKFEPKSLKHKFRMRPPKAKFHTQSDRILKASAQNEPRLFADLFAALSHEATALFAALRVSLL